MTSAFAAAVVKGRIVVVVGWIALATLMAVSVQDLTDAQSGALAQLVPENSRAIEAEQLSAARFASRSQAGRWSSSATRRAYPRRASRR